MSEDSESHFTITLSERGRVVKRYGGPDDIMPASGSVSRSKPSVKDRLGTVADDSSPDRNHPVFKWQRIEQNQGFCERNGLNDTMLGNDDLRLKLLQKNMSVKHRDNDPLANIDLRDKLSSKAALASADRRRSCSPLATLGKRKSMMDTRDSYDSRFNNMVDHHAYDGKRQNSMQEPRDNYDSERHSMRDPRDIYNLRGSNDLERHSMRNPRDTYNLGSQSVRDPRDTYNFDRRSVRNPGEAYGIERQRMRDPRYVCSPERQTVRDPRDAYGVERQRMHDTRDTYSFGRGSIRDPRDDYGARRQELRDGYIAGRQSMHGPRDTYKAEKRSIQGPRDSYNVDRRRLHDPRNSYNVDKRNIQRPRGSYNIESRTVRDPRYTNGSERRSMRDSRGSYSVQEQRMPERRDNYSAGRRSTREPRDTFNIQRRNMPEPRERYAAERRNMREPRNAYNGGKPKMLDNDYGYRRMTNVGPSSNRGGDAPAADHRTPYTLNSLRQRSSDRAGASRSPERTNLRRGSPDTVFSSSMSPDERSNLRQRSPDTIFSSSMSPDERTNIRRGSPDRVLSPSISPDERTNIQRRSTDGEFSSSISPERNTNDLQNRQLIRTYDDAGTSDLYKRNEVSSPQRAARASSLIRQPGSSAVPHLPGNATLISAEIPQSSRLVLRIPNHVKEPTIESFLQSLGLEEYSSHFNDEEVDFHALTAMSDTELIELGLPMGPRKRILHALMTWVRR